MTEQPHLDHESSAVQKHLEIMQGVITRMAENSRHCKVWCVTLVAATLVLVARTEEPQHALIALIPTLLFLFLDSYYLALERAFIRSQNAFVAKLHKDELKRTDIFKVAPIGMGWRLVGRCLGSISIWLFYPLLVVTVVLTWQLILPASTIDRENNEKCGLVGLLLPHHPDYWKDPEDHNPRLIPQTLARNIDGNAPFAAIYKWPRQRMTRRVMPKVRRALLRKDKTPCPDDSLDLFAENRSGDCSLGWQNQGGSKLI